jgi:hypothetical protein
MHFKLVLMKTRDCPNFRTHHYVRAGRKVGQCMILCGNTHPFINILGISIGIRWEPTCGWIVRRAVAAPDLTLWCLKNGGNSCVGCGVPDDIVVIVVASSISIPVGSVSWMQFPGCARRGRVCVREWWVYACTCEHLWLYCVLQKNSINFYLVHTKTSKAFPPL